MHEAWAAHGRALWINHGLLAQSDCHWDEVNPATNNLWAYCWTVNIGLFSSYICDLNKTSIEDKSFILDAMNVGITNHMSINVESNKPTFNDSW